MCVPPHGLSVTTPGGAREAATVSSQLARVLEQAGQGDCSRSNTVSGGQHDIRWLKASFCAFEDQPTFLFDQTLL
jgi:hypothetical protein